MARPRHQPEWIRKRWGSVPARGRTEVPPPAPKKLERKPFAPAPTEAPASLYDEVDRFKKLEIDDSKPKGK